MTKTNNNDILVSIVVPSLNEETTIEEFVNWCKEGIERAKVKAEILIVDSSTDKTADIAQRAGATVIKVPHKGIGQAYIDATPHINGKYVILGDCDLTYDFREIKPFIDKLDAGYSFVLGTRLKGKMKKGAMSSLHRYFGTPLLTFVINSMYGSRFSDIACGMRAVTLEALKKMMLTSSSWDYASEMILKANKLKLKSTEIPIKFYKDRDNRISHLRRSGKFTNWKAGWVNLKLIFLLAPDFFLLKPGFVSMVLGLLLVVSLTVKNTVKIGTFAISSHSMLFGVALVVVGYSLFQMGILSRAIYARFNEEKYIFYKKIFSYNRGVLIGLGLIACGLILLSAFIFHYVKNGFMLFEISRSAIVGLLLCILGFQTFTFTLIFNMTVHRNENEK